MLYVQRRDKQVLKYKFSTMATLLTIVPGTFLSIWLIYRGRVQGLIGQLVDRRVIGYYVPQIIGGAVVAIVIWTRSGIQSSAYSRSLIHPDYEPVR